MAVTHTNSRRGNGATMDQFNKELPPSQNGGTLRTSDDIEILHTETLIKEVCRLKIVSYLNRSTSIPNATELNHRSM